MWSFRSLGYQKVLELSINKHYFSSVIRTRFYQLLSKLPHMERISWFDWEWFTWWTVWEKIAKTYTIEGKGSRAMVNGHMQVSELKTLRCKKSWPRFISCRGHIRSKVQCHDRLGRQNVRRRYSSSETSKDQWRETEMPTIADSEHINVAGIVARHCVNTGNRLRYRQ